MYYTDWIIFLDGRSDLKIRQTLEGNSRRQKPLFIYVIHYSLFQVMWLFIADSLYEWNKK